MGKPSITIEQATVYRAAGRRYFTKRAACLGLARAQLREEMGGCTCTRFDWDTGAPATACDYHELDPFVITERARELGAALGVPAAGEH